LADWWKTCEFLVGELLRFFAVKPKPEAACIKAENAIAMLVCADLEYRWSAWDPTGTGGCQKIAHVTYYQGICFNGVVAVLSRTEPYLRNPLSMADGNVDTYYVPEVPVLIFIKMRSARILFLHSNYATKLSVSNVEVIATDIWSVPVYRLDCVVVAEVPIIAITNRGRWRKRV